MVPPLHTCPATRQLVAPVADATSHTPSAAPLALLHCPPQHSASVAQASPVCVQKEGVPLQTPLVQTLEQQSAFAAQVLPAVRQEEFSGAHFEVPPSPVAEHTPPQH